MATKKILLVGGAGFIGYNIALKLSKNPDYELLIIDSLSVNNFSTVIGDYTDIKKSNLSLKILNNRFETFRLNSIKLSIIDARNYSELSNIFSIFKPNVVIQLAAVSHSNLSNKDPHSTFDNSFRTLENALDNAKNRIDHFIYFSSSMVYGNFKKDKVDENSEANPLGIYGALKYSGEKIVIAYNQVFDLPYTIIRPSALYGRGCISRRVGQIFIENALLGKKIIINGDGEETLDFTYIDDLVDGIEKIIENKNSLNEIFNITYGSSRPINNLIKILQKDFPNIEIEHKIRDKLMPKRGTLSIEKAKKLLNYDPQWPLEKGYPDYIKWYKDIFKDFK